LLDDVPLAPERSTFVDLGAGMGRVVLHAARRPFRQIIGVELSPALLEVAKENRDAYRGPRACADVRLVRADAATFTFPRGDLVVYLYNPFAAVVLAAVLDRLAKQKGSVAIVYHTPVEAALIDAHPAFVAASDAGVGRIWRSRRELEP
jgi:SAM-dependent methyltransferase